MSWSRVALVSLAIALANAPSLSAQAEKPWHPTLPASDSYAGFVAFVTTDFMIPDEAKVLDEDWDAFSELLAAGRVEGVYLLAKAFHEAAPRKLYWTIESGPFQFRNPISLAYKAKNFLDAGANLRTYFVEYLKDENPQFYTSNLLSVSRSPRMDQFLVSRGLPTICEANSPGDATCNDSNVRFRSSPSTDGKVIASLNKGDKVEVLGYTYKTYTIGQYSGRWVKARFKDQVGWVLQAFLEGPYYEM